MRLIVLVLTAVLMVAAAPATAAGRKDEISQALANTPSITLFSLQPGQQGKRDAGGTCTGDCYFGWPILGKTVVSTAAAESIRRDLVAWVAAPEPEAVAMCSNPRHGVRVLANGHAYDFVVCFECGQAQVFKDSAIEPIAFLFHDTNQAPWDQVLASVNIPLAIPEDLDE